MFGWSRNPSSLYFVWDQVIWKQNTYWIDTQLWGSSTAFPILGGSSLDCHGTGSVINQGNRQTEIYRSLLLTGIKREADPPCSPWSSMTRLGVWFVAGSVNTIQLQLFLLSQSKSYLNKHIFSVLETLAYCHLRKAFVFTLLVAHFYHQNT